MNNAQKVSPSVMVEPEVLICFSSTEACTKLQMCLSLFAGSLDINKNRA